MVAGPKTTNDFVLSNTSDKDVQIVGFVSSSGRILVGPLIPETDAAEQANQQSVYWQKLSENAASEKGPLTLAPGTMVAIRVQGEILFPPRVILGDAREVLAAHGSLEGSAAIPNAQRAFESFPDPCQEGNYRERLGGYFPTKLWDRE